MTTFDGYMTTAFNHLLATFGQQVTITPKGGEGSVITGILGNQSEDEREDDIGRRRVFSRPLTISVDPTLETYGGYATPAKYDTITIGGVVWTIEDIIGQGAVSSEMTIIRDIDVSRHDEGHYVRESA